MNGVDWRLSGEAVVRGVRVRYAEAGSGPPLLLVHGILVDHVEWADLVPRLADRFRCIAPDLPGFGGSDKPSPEAFPYTREAFAESLAGLLDALGLSRVHVCGHSMGGAISLTFAADFPERVERLTVVDAACYPMPLPLKGRLPLLPVVGPFVFKKLYRKPVFRDYFRTEVYNGRPLRHPQRVDAWYRTLDTPEGREAAYAALRRSVADLESLGPKIPRIQAPSLIVWGAEDRLVPVGLGHRLVKELPHAHLELIDGVGHAPNEEAPERLAALLVRHHLGDPASATNGAD